MPESPLDHAADGGTQETQARGWARLLRYDPVPPLRSCENPAIRFFARRDLLDEDPGPVAQLWQLPEVEKLLRHQHEDGRWHYRGSNAKGPRSQDYDQLETYRSLGILVEKYGMTRTHPSIGMAAEFLFARQTEHGDFRGIYGTQYTPNYTGGILELLIKAGYSDDPRTERTFDWFRGTRQAGGGWAIPLQTVGARFDRAVMEAPTLQPDLSRPSSHLVTGCVLRAYAAHPRHRQSQEAREAGAFLASSLLRRGTYPGRDTIDFWTKFSFPFWFTDIASALDSLSLLDFHGDLPGISAALHWLIEHQDSDGLWQARLLHSAGDHYGTHWVALAMARILHRLFS